jgi:hypothetical protein
MAAVAAILTAPATGWAKTKKLEAEAPLVATENAPLGASGEIDFRLKDDRMDLKIEIEDVPLGAYDVVIDGILRGSLTVVTTMDGPEGELEFRNRASDSKIFLDFDPAGLVVQIQQADVTLLAGVVPDLDINDPASANHEDKFPKQKLKIDMTPTVAAGPDAKGKIKYKSNQKGADLDLKAKDFPEGTYDLVVNDVVIMSFFYKGRGQGQLRFSTRPRGQSLPLNFDPAGATFRIVQGDTDFFTATLTAAVPLPAVAGPGELEVELAPTGVQPLASGEAEYEEEPDKKEFSVEIEDVTPGTYDLFVDGINVGMIIATSTSEGVKGEIEFRNPLGDDLGKTLLNFDPRGKTVQVLQGGVVILGADFPTSS